MLDVLDTLLYALGILVGATVIASVVVFGLFAFAAIRQEFHNAMRERRTP